MEKVLEYISNIEKEIIKIKSLFNKEENTDLKELMALLKLPDWVQAIDPDLICKSEEDKENRAEGIIELLLDKPAKDLSFLDFGCGEGYITKKLAEQGAKISVGYDIHKTWKDWKGVKFTSEWKEVVNNGPYDIIFLYDVVDHIEGTDEDVVSTIGKIKQVMKNSVIYVRCHPFTSKHATHLYEKINKAYLHLIFTEEELKAIGYEGVFTRKIFSPLATYKNWFVSAGFQLFKKDQIYRETVDSFFIENRVIADRLKSHWGNYLPIGQIEHQFIDYILK